MAHFPEFSLTGRPVVMDSPPIAQLALTPRDDAKGPLEVLADFPGATAS